MNYTILRRAVLIATTGILLAGAASALPAKPVTHAVQSGQERLWLVANDGESESVDTELGDPNPGDGMMWAGGDPNFCEACDGVVIDDSEAAELGITMVDSRISAPAESIRVEREVSAVGHGAGLEGSDGLHDGAEIVNRRLHVTR